MVRSNRSEFAEMEVLEVLQFLQAWRIVVTADGRLSIRPSGESLRLVEFARLVQRLRTCCDGEFPSEILFDLNQVHVVGAPQSIIRRLMGQFAQSVNTRCKVIGYRSG